MCCTRMLKIADCMHSALLSTDTRHKQNAEEREVSVTARRGKDRRDGAWPAAHWVRDVMVLRCAVLFLLLPMVGWLLVWLAGAKSELSTLRDIVERHTLSHSAFSSQSVLQFEIRSKMARVLDPQHLKLKQKWRENITC